MTRAWRFKGPVTHKGRRYATHKDAARALGINYVTYMGRLRSGKDPTDATNRKAVSVRIKGVKYASVAAAARALNMPVPTLHDRIHHGRQLDAPREKGPTPARFKGRWYPTHTALARKLGISVSTMMKRIENGTPLDAPRLTRMPGEGHLEKKGYWVIRGRRRCRVEMERKLGRRLRPGETVHHKNGIRSDDSPSNLELWVKRGQPYGQRVSDRIRAAAADLRRYAPGFLSQQGGSRPPSRLRKRRREAGIGEIYAAA